jgi:predicted regulator of Ras-like GTPase activity (Roadblock/LC7/MglB family)
VFESTLKKLVNRVDGARGAAVLNLDGVVLEAVDEKGNDLGADAALSEYAPVIGQLLGATDSLDLGEPTQLTLEGAERTTLVRRLTDKYVAALHVSPDSLLGKAHFHLRVAAPDLAREL